jgi:starch phosphorylase
MIAASPILGEVLDTIASGVFSSDDEDRYMSLLDSMINHDYFLVTADFEAYYAKQREVDSLWRDRTAWWQASILNTARVGWFSSDRAVREYADEIWNVSVGRLTAE